MWLIVDQSLAAGFITINTQQQRASLPFKSGVLKRKVYNNDDKTLFSVLTIAKLRGSGCNTLSHWGLATVKIQKRMFYPLIKQCFSLIQFKDIILLVGLILP